MAFLSSWTTRCLFVIFLPLLSISATNAVSVKCGECQKSLCPELNYYSCEGKLVKDRCGCCTVCSSSKNQPHPLISNDDDHGESEGSACSKVKCPKFKVCVENMQGLPLCTCPGPFICKRRSRQKPVCGTDGVTYESRCYLRIAACNSAARIKVARRGPCNGAEVPRPRTCDSFSSCRRRKNQNPVCGTDSKTYMSRCHMKIMACQKGVKIKLKHHGTCEAPSSSGRAPTHAQRMPGVLISKLKDSDKNTPVNDVRGRKERRRRKKKGGNEVSGKEEGKKKRRKQRRDKRKQRQDRRRKRRKTRGNSRQRRYQADRQYLRNRGHIQWK